MKCKHCNGTGATNWYVNRAFVTCPYCGGTGEMEGNMTNDEWRQTCSGEEFAEFLDRLAYSLYTNQNKMTCKDDWLVWLKEKHE